MRPGSVRSNGAAGGLIMHTRSGMDRWRSIMATVALIVAALSNGGASADVQYIVTDLDVLHPGWQTLATGLNNNGVASGVAEAPGFDPYRAARLDNGDVLDLGVFGGAL